MTEETTGVELSSAYEFTPVAERYYYVAFSYTSKGVSGFGNICTKIPVTEQNLNAEFVPSFMAQRIKKEHMLNSVIIVNWREMTKSQYDLEQAAR